MSKVYEPVTIPSYPRGQGNCSRCGHAEKAEKKEGQKEAPAHCTTTRTDGNGCQCPGMTTGNWKTRYDKTPVPARRGN